MNFKSNKPVQFSLPENVVPTFEGARGPSGDPVKRIGVLFAGAGCSYEMVRLLLVHRALPLDFVVVLLETCGAGSQRDHEMGTAQLSTCA